jgi:hypothetical protein
VTEVKAGDVRWYLVCDYCVRQTIQWLFPDLVMMKKPSVQNARDVFALWKEDDRDLESKLDEIRDWMIDSSEVEVLRFADLAARLSELRANLITHFDRENELSEQLREY